MVELSRLGGGSSTFGPMVRTLLLGFGPDICPTRKGSVMKDDEYACRTAIIRTVYGIKWIVYNGTAEEVKRWALSEFARFGPVEFMGWGDL